MGFGPPSGRARTAPPPRPSATASLHEWAPSQAHLGNCRRHRVLVISSMVRRRSVSVKVPLTAVRLPLGIEDLVRSIRDELPSGSPLDHLHTAVELADQANALGDGLVGHFVEAARGEGCSWAQIGAELGVSKQAAQQRFVARPIDALTRGCTPSVPWGYASVGSGSFPASPRRRATSSRSPKNKRESSAMMPCGRRTSCCRFCATLTGGQPWRSFP